MTADRLKELLTTKPFEPFEIHVEDGDVLTVKHPELMWITPGGRTIFVARGPKEEDGIAIIDSLLITKLIIGSSRRNGRKKSQQRHTVRPMRPLAKLLLSCLLILEFSENACAQHGPFSDKIVFFGSRNTEEASPVVRTFAPETAESTDFVLFSDEVPLAGRVSPDAKLLAVSLVKRENGVLTKHPSLEIIDPEGNRRKIAEDAEVVAWSPDSQKVLCRRGKYFDWSHCLVDLQNGQETALPIEPKEAVMDWSPDGKTLCVMKGRPESQWQRGADDFYPKRQLYFVPPDGTQPQEPFTDTDDDCILWRYSPSGTKAVYYRRYYSTGRPIETAMVADADGRNATQLVDFTKLGIRPNGSPCWSPDEKEVVWQVSRESSDEHFEWELLFIPVSGAQPRYITVDDLGVEFFGAIDWK